MVPIRPRPGVVFVGCLVLGGLAAALPILPSIAAADAKPGSRYVVEPGDTLIGVAREAGVSADVLAAANGITNPNRLVAGTTLTIPSRSTSSKPSTSPATSTASSGGSSYTVQQGDTWWGIARRQGIRPEDLAAANGVSVDTTLLAGRRITVPAGARTTSAPAPAASAGGTSYTVRAGDTLTAIANRYGVTVRALASVNDRRVDALLPVGARLAIPAGAAAPAASRTPATPVTPATTVGPAAASRTSSGLPGAIRSNPARAALGPMFESAAAEFGVPVDLLKSVGYMESGWQPDVISYKGAMGVGQLMPETAAEVARWLGDPNLDPWDAADNIRMSARYLRHLLDLNGGSSSGALAAYYQGHVSVQRRGLDTDTQNYVRVIEGNRPMFV